MRGPRALPPVTSQKILHIYDCHNPRLSPYKSTTYDPSEGVQDPLDTAQTGGADPLPDPAQTPCAAKLAHPLHQMEGSQGSARVPLSACHNVTLL